MIEFFEREFLISFRSRWLKIMHFYTLIFLFSSCTYEASVTKLSPTSSPRDFKLQIGDGRTSSLEVDEGASIVFVVSQNKSREVNTYLQISVTSETGVDIASAFSGSFPLFKTIPIGDTSASITLSTLHDLRYTGPHIYKIILSTDDNNVSTSFQLSVKDLESAPKLSLSTATQSFSETSGSGTSTVQLSVESTTPISATYTFVDGTAINGSDYTGADGQLIFAPGETTKIISYNIIDNAVYGGNKTFTIALAGGSAQAVTIMDDELPMGSFNITGVTATNDVLIDTYLSNATSPTVNWQSSTGATSYDVTIYQNDGTTVQCATQNSLTTSFDMGGSCALLKGQNYKAKVFANLGVQTQGASNNLFSFYVNQSPSLGSGGNGPWYVMAGSNIVINALWATSPTVGVATDPESDVVNFTATGGATLGTVDISAGTSLIYTAGTSNGQDSFTYTITDAKGGSFTGTMVIHVVKPFSWTGKVSSLWTSASNWCGTTTSADSRSCNSAVAAPGASDIIYFDNTCESAFTCAPTTSSNISVDGVNIKANGFTQGTGFTIDIGSSSWVQSGGSFSGSNANVNILGGLYTQTAGSANFGTGTLLLNLSQATSLTAMTLSSVANLTFSTGGTFFVRTYGACSTPSYTLFLESSVLFENVVVESPNTGCGVPNLLVSGTGQYNIMKLLKLGFAANVSQGTLKLYGDLEIDGSTFGSTGVVEFLGNNTSTYKYSSGVAPILKINKAAGAVVEPAITTTNMTQIALEVTSGIFNFPSGTLTLSARKTRLDFFTIQSGASVSIPPGSSVIMNFESGCGNPTYIIDPDSSISFENLTMTANTTGCGPNRVSIAAGKSVTVNGNLTREALPSLWNDIHLKGNLSIISTNSLSSLGSIIFDGTLDQTITRSPGAFAPRMVINKSNGSVVNLLSDINAFNDDDDFTLLNGVLNLNGYQLSVTNGSGTNNVLTFSPGTTVNLGGTGSYSGEQVITAGATINP